MATLVFLPGISHGGKSLVGHSPRSCKELDTTELLHSLSHSLAKQRCNCLPEAKCKGQVWVCQSGNVAAALYAIGRCESALSSESSISNRD